MYSGKSHGSNGICGFFSHVVSDLSFGMTILETASNIVVPDQLSLCFSASGSAAR